jgi:chorismate mutase
VELTLEALRRELDVADVILVEALRRRLRCVEKIAAHKAEHGLPAYDPEREVIVAKMVSDGSGGDDRVAAMHRAVVLVCRAEVERVRGLRITAKNGSRFERE